MSKKKNSYSFFLDHYFEEERRKGRNISKRIAAEECGPLWKQLPDDKKQLYIDLAKAFKSDREMAKGVSNECSDSYSKSGNVSAETKPDNEIIYLAGHIRHEKALRSHKFYIIHCNYYCRTEDRVYLPAEIALAEFSLENGITQTYHTLINPSSVPLGYGFEVRRIIDEVHGLPFPPHDEGESSPARLLNAIFNFMKSSKENEDDYPPLFTLDENVEASTEILKGLTKAVGSRSTLKVFPVHRMFFWLKNKCTEHCGNEPGFPVLANAVNEIEKDVFRYCTGISCQLHMDISDKFQNCSLSIVQRLVYVICDHCCRHLKIKLVKGKHIHQNLIKRTGESLLETFRSDLSDVTSNPPEESDFCGASTYASSVIDDYQYEVLEGFRIKKEVKEEDEEEEEDEGWRRIERGRGRPIKLEYDDPDDAFMMTVRGRGKRIGNVQQNVGLPRS